MYESGSPSLRRARCIFSHSSDNNQTYQGSDQNFQHTSWINLPDASSAEKRKNFSDHENWKIANPKLGSLCVGGVSLFKNTDWAKWEIDGKNLVGEKMGVPTFNVASSLETVGEWPLLLKIIQISLIGVVILRASEIVPTRTFWIFGILFTVPDEDFPLSGVMFLQVIGRLLPKYSLWTSWISTKLS